MPRVYLSESDRLSQQLASWAYGEMKCRGVTQKEMASELGICQQALSRKFKTRSFTFKDFVGFVNVLEPDEREISRLLGRR